MQRCPDLKLSPPLPQHTKTGVLRTGGVGGEARSRTRRARLGHGCRHAFPPDGSMALALQVFARVTSKHIQLRNAEAEYRGISYAL